MSWKFTQKWWFVLTTLFLVGTIAFLCGTHCPKKDRDIRALVRQTARWAVASQQDSSPMIALLHANYAAGYLQALELIATEDEIHRTTDLQKLRTKVYGIQDRAARMVLATCPQYSGKMVDKELAQVGISSGGP